MSTVLDARRDCGTPVFVPFPSSLPEKGPNDDVWLEKVYNLLAESENGLSLHEVNQSLRRDGNKSAIQAIHRLMALGQVVSKRSKSASGRGRRTYHAVTKGGA